MKARLFLIMMAAAMIPASTATAQQPVGVAPDSEETAIRKAVQGYIDGIMTYDAPLLRRVFHPEAVVTASLPRGEYRRPFAEWIRFTEGRAPQDTSGYVNRIVRVDHDGTAAIVKTRLEWPTITYVDYLSLLKIGGEWKIVAKIWHQEPPTRKR